MATYTKVSADVRQQIKRLIDKHHPDLIEAKLTVCCLFAYAERDKRTGEPKGPALKHANWPAAALVKINSLKDRVAGLEDATILLDGDQWENWTEPEQLSILDHELTHLEIRPAMAEKAPYV